MKRELASQILYNFNMKQMTILSDYCDERISDLQFQLEQAQDIGDVRSIQGQIRELRQVKKIYEHATSVVDLERVR